MNEYDLDTEETFVNDIKTMKILVKRINNGFLMNIGSGYSFYNDVPSIIKKIEEQIPKLWR